MELKYLGTKILKENTGKEYGILLTTFIQKGY